MLIPVYFFLPPPPSQIQLRACLVFSRFSGPDPAFFCRAADSVIPALRSASRRLVFEASRNAQWEPQQQHQLAVHPGGVASVLDLVQDAGHMDSTPRLSASPSPTTPGSARVPPRAGPMLEALPLLEQICFTTSTMLVDVTQKGGFVCCLHGWSVLETPIGTHRANMGPTGRYLHAPLSSCCVPRRFLHSSILLLILPPAFSAAARARHGDGSSGHSELTPAGTVRQPWGWLPVCRQQWWKAFQGGHPRRHEALPGRCSPKAGPDGLLAGSRAGPGKHTAR